MQKTCRVCYETDERTSKLISPCNCKGTSQYIHDHCLSSWQAIAKTRHSQLEHAFICQICRTYYRQSCWYSIHFWEGIYFRYYQQFMKFWNRTKVSLLMYLNWIQRMAIIFACLPLKYVLHNLLLWLCIWFGDDKQLHLNSFVLCTDNGKDLYFKSYQHPVYPKRGRIGDLLVASRATAPDSRFHKKVILLVQHDGYKSAGVIINDNITNPISLQAQSTAVCEIGGEFDPDTCVVVHTKEPPSWLLSRRVAVIGSSCPVFITLCSANELSDVLNAIQCCTSCRYCEDLSQSEHSYGNAMQSASIVNYTRYSYNYSGVVDMTTIQCDSHLSPMSDESTAVSSTRERVVSSRVSSTAHQSQQPHQPQQPQQSDHLHSQPPSTLPPLPHRRQQHQHYVRVLRGLTTWQAGQLEGELRDGDWCSMPGSLTSLFTHSRPSLWNALRNHYDVNHANIF